MITGIAEIVLWAQNKHDSVAFYRDLLGLDVISPPELPNVFLKAGEGAAGIPQMIVIVPMPQEIAAQPRGNQLHHLAFELQAENFDALESALRKAGYQPRGGTHQCSPAARCTLTTRTETKLS